jgi:Pyruvate/2-oxoacid:ferredoxin oxidoreductase delta subunit
LIVGEPFASFVAEHHPLRSRWIDADEAVSILKAVDSRGHVHHAFFKDAMLGRFYAICNCCSCCCGAIGAFQRGTPMLASSGFVSAVDEELCIGCGECGDYCQFHALSMNETHVVVDHKTCMGCGVCVNHCAKEALSLRIEPGKGDPLEIMKLMNQLG